MSQWIIYFNENGSEYTGSLVVNFKSKQISDNSFMVNGVIIAIDENIQSIKKVEKIFEQKDTGEKL